MLLKQDFLVKLMLVCNAWAAAACSWPLFHAYLADIHAVSIIMNFNKNMHTNYDVDFYTIINAQYGTNL